MSDLSRQLLASGWFGDRARERLAVLRNLDPVVLLATAALLLCGLVFIGSATQDDAKFADQQGRQALFVACSVGIGFFVVLVHYARWMRAAWLFYGVVLLALLGLPLFAPVINGARRWYAFPGFSVQPSSPNSPWWWPWRRCCVSRHGRARSKGCSCRCWSPACRRR
jgi:cell division protein FtsW (lipid II flippase)